MTTIPEDTLLRAESILRQGLITSVELLEEDAAQEMYDTAVTVAAMLEPYVSRAEVTEAEEEVLDLALRARAALPEDLDL